MGVYLEDFEEFQAAAQSLFTTSPLRTRYLSKYRHCDSKVILKVTNDKVCLKYRTNQIADLRKIERFSQAYARWMVSTNLENLGEPDEELEGAKEASKTQSTKKKGKKQ